jgi:hypothetical protein
MVRIGTIGYRFDQKSLILNLGGVAVLKIADGVQVALAYPSDVVP